MASEAFNWLGFAGLTVARAPCAPTLAQQKAHVAADLWKDYFRDPSHWWDNRKSKTNPRDTDFKHKVTKESLWIDGLYSPSWVKDRLGLKETEVSSMVKHKEKELEDGGWEVFSSLQETSVENIACLLHKYTKERNLVYALRLHAYMRSSGLEAHKSLGNLLVSMLVEVGRMHDAQQVFDRLMYRNDCSWNSLITGYVKHGEPSHALILYQTMQQHDDSAHPSGYTFVALLKACAQLKDIERGCKIHAEIARKGLVETNIFIGSTLVHMYSKCGLLAKAQKVFDKLQVRDTVLWNALITGYAEHGHGEEALNCFEQMQLEGISPNDVTFVCSLKACGSIRATEKGQELHAEIAKKGLLERDLVVGSTLVDMYAKCGLLVEAQEVFDKLAVRDTVSWSALMAGYAEHRRGEEALNCFEQMQFEGVARDAFTFACSLKACGSIGAIDKGLEIHAELIRKGFERDLVVGSSLVDMYAKCGLLAKAHEVFDTLPVQDIVLWSSLIAGYAEHGCGEEALNCFNQMQLEGISPDVVTFACSLKACGSIGAIDKGKEIHAMIAKNGLEGDLFVGNTLVDMYGKYGLVAKAQEAFDKLLVRDRVSWNALIAGYAEHGHAEEALNCFKNMQLEGISPNAITFVCSLKACGSIGTTDKGQEIHTEIARKGLERDLVVGGTLVHMYARCGLLVEAQEVFEKLPVRHAVSWNALIAGYAQLGESENVFHVFDRMTVEGEKPDLVTFLSVLHACCHAGLVDQGQTYFEAMSKDYGIFPSIEHHTCMVDLLGRAGQLGKAVAMIKKMPYHPDRAVWHTMLGACQKWGNVELGRLAFEHAVHLDEKDAAAYVCMCNIYANAGMWEDANKVEAMRVRKQAWKQPGHCWWTDAEGTVRSFFVSDTGYSQIKNFYAKLEDLSAKMREEGHVLGLQWVPQDVSNDAKKDGLCQHSEKLAIVCALIDTPKGTPVHVVKNLRVCNDCHSAMAIISKIEQRSFFVKDANRLHVFEQGKCYCGDCW